MAGRLSRALAACVALALIVMVAASTLVMRSWMLANMDSELHRLSQRAGERLAARMLRRSAFALACATLLIVALAATPLVLVA